MSFSHAWLTKLKARELHRLATRIGTPCSGTKPVVFRGVQDALASLTATDQHVGGRSHISLVSIDMGIRNLAYSHWTADFMTSTEQTPGKYKRPVLQAWRKIDVSSRQSTRNFTEDAKIMSASTSHAGDADTLEATAEKESFEPIEYANHAYNFTKAILDEHKPTHVIIERQRFRTGGKSAVSEWTLRVGVFEGMLHAALKSLAEECQSCGKFSVESVLPRRVNRYWFEDYLRDETNPLGCEVSKKSSREVKQMKIELVQRLLRSDREDSLPSLFAMAKDVAAVTSAVLDAGNKANKVQKSGRKGASRNKQEQSELSKLDDLADSFLQGLAWLRWQNSRLKCLTIEHQDMPLAAFWDWVYNTDD